ncbi:hypothetical protein SAMN05444149_101194 [Pseudosulfitobacter pseudonitzschiae]|uniref:Uncharacterized protein n=1 Tax=Pseudosulfitobacter pseudonitzschiae TaxID=1402135 RepID=A0A073J849_9RHOB|nr:hypothetical protein [Pseudosulfitobacter pseudonitzschiae]KEJ98099.1 hypothetical protein SUH3_03645 [Pseudosulfitobacter pseudonitzschiae]QKS09342.1 hypothetical protein HT745_13100 [Pseudosulfitobacter pseudonitzschiae]SHE47223.1 hypothetical protein SAMN05444149_101194 [Pseudosulfitobacter pseudonitzschiae]
MTKVQIGAATFTATHKRDVTELPQGYGSDPGMVRQWNRIRQSSRLHWDCATQSRRPDVYPKGLTAPAHLLVYDMGPNILPSAADVAAASAQAGRVLMTQAGFADARALDDALVAGFGRAMVNFDIDALIAPLKPEFRLRIVIELRYMHFLLTHPKILGNAVVLLSLPDMFHIGVRRVARCTEEGLRQEMQLQDDVTSVPVRAGNTLSWKLRRDAREQMRKELADRIAQAKATRAALQEQIDGSKPEGD